MLFETLIHIDADPARTFATFTDLRNAAAHVRGIKHIEVLSDGPIRKGTQFRETRSIFNRDATETMEITAFDPPRRYAVRCESYGARIDTEFRFNPEAGGTRVGVIMKSEPISIVAKMMAPMMGWMMASTMRQCFENDLADIKAAAEGKTPSAA